MATQRLRIDRYLSKRLGINRRDVKLLLAQSRVLVDGIVVDSVELIVDQFSIIQYDSEILQEKTRRYVMLNKPAGVVSATQDDEHETALSLLDDPSPSELHIAGRLDIKSTGLLLLTNDSHWSKKLSNPEHKVAKIYLVRVQNPITREYVQAFREGMYFEFEDITTKPVLLEIISVYVAKLTLTEGRYHQIKRMFGRFRNPVLELHRSSIGHIQLDVNLLPGQFRDLTEFEIALK